MKKYDVMSTLRKGTVLFTAEVDERLVDEPLLKRAAVEWAKRNGVPCDGADLASADLSGLNLLGQNFAYSNLSNAVLTDAILNNEVVFFKTVMMGVIYDPILKVDDLDGKILAAIEAGGCLYMRDWHKCDTTHCRAGWAIVMAGEAGKALEAKVGSYLTGALIYAASYPTEPIPNFFASEDSAMRDIEKRAALAA